MWLRLAWLLSLSLLSITILRPGYIPKFPLFIQCISTVKEGTHVLQLLIGEPAAEGLTLRGILTIELMIE